VESINLRKKYSFIVNLKITIKPLIEFDAPKWSRTKFWSAGALKSDLLEDKVERKNDKVQHYVDRYDQIWLFLVFEGNKSSDAASLIPDDFVFKNYWLFDQIIVFNLATNEFCELRNDI
jgi:hypothetical protein